MTAEREHSADPADLHGEVPIAADRAPSGAPVADHDCGSIVRRGRAAAGKDPAKRKQIMEGAARVFSAMGFDAASMNDIAREAGVSKGTLYVYFDHKEELFCALINDQRHKHIQDLFALIDDDPDIRATLTRFGIAFARLLTSDWAVRVQRVVLGVAERMPDTGRAFFSEGPGCGCALMAEYFDQMVRRGLLTIQDTMLASNQFTDLCQSGLLRPRMYRWVDHAPTEAEIEQVVRHAVDMFLTYYGPRTPPPA
ncbi:TetR/AcrR family transcriptional regulator [Rhodoplanes roseus]|uniref:HTH tetR-type domain-containing protein n=1 Tax=Rhodoplanes roseus TaxID=29409 RepID=A0A327L1Z4_9BRAD|nr:TetR/AcrR family transcriptional regulator [Rhodoplanes roseus]RAI44969.1 hypothetical protein CH341_06350 [Rhodoplanes roseus]